MLAAPPGSGKTTLVPLALLDEPWLAGRAILVSEPRRLAARAAATRMADLLGERVGETVGYRVRFDQRVSARTRIEVVTEGILLRRLQGDPALEGVGLVMLDEAHERSLLLDLALALVLDVQGGLREDLRLLLSSATLDTAAAARVLGGAPVVSGGGRSFPVEVSYLAREPTRPVPDTVSEAVRRALTAHAGDVLAFLPGGGEIRATADRLAGLTDTEVVPLYGDLPGDAQDRALRPAGAGRRRVVLATPIAETSLTIEGVRVVVDSGLARRPRFDPASGLTRLETFRVSRASADQRAGRAGRLGPGVAYRLWTEATQRGLLAHTPPEILEADLATLALELAQWGVTGPAALRWVDPPPAGAFAQARELLTALGALDPAGRVTAAGRRMAELPFHPRLARMVLAAAQVGEGPLGADLAALLSERDVLRAGGQPRPTDLADRIDALRRWREQGDAGARAAGADSAACARVDRAARQARQFLAKTGTVRSSAEQGAARIAPGPLDRKQGKPSEETRMSPLPGPAWLSAADGAAQPAPRAPERRGRRVSLETGASPTPRPFAKEGAGGCEYREGLRGKGTPGSGEGEPSALGAGRAGPGLLLALAYPDRIGQRQGGGGSRYRLASGRGARLPEGDPLAREAYLVAASIEAGTADGRVFLAAALDAHDLADASAGRRETVEVVEWDDREGAVVARVEERLGALLLASRPLDRPEAGRVGAALLEGIRRRGLAVLPWTDAARELQARVLSLRAWRPAEAWPDLTEAALTADLDRWLAPYLAGMSRLGHLQRLDLPGALQARVQAAVAGDWRRRLEEGAPTHLQVPSGARRRLVYAPGEPPVLAVKLQELFGLADTPRVCWGEVPVTLHLLSPAGRPMQVTRDLRSFWERTYPEVRRELRGR
ncbi:MAG: ATP-dependent helicase HrpB, partial [Gammaproteobacteria bacterium]|nr:ATP-dependent helicase HrpB [Gammaproteobacteria bacterium]